MFHVIGAFEDLLLVLTRAALYTACNCIDQKEEVWPFDPIK
jgi:hypothetical protein